MIDEWSGTLTLTEASSRELMRVLEKQDAEFMDALFNGKCGFTLKCTDGRSVELVPKADRKTEPQKMCDAYCNEDCIECAKETELWKAEQTEPQMERHLPDYSYEADLGRRIMEQTDCSWR